ncbi:MAG TPA: hypothetical protein VIL01_07785 [Thermomicrobiales bacterium]
MPARRLLLALTLLVGLGATAFIPTAAALAQDATPEATPVGTPAATPEASPVGSPAATPEATPIASPVASPVASPEASPEGTPTAEAGVRLDLAAMALASDDLPPEVSLIYEFYMTGEEVAVGLAGALGDSDSILASDLLWFYQSQYESPDGTIRIRTYVEEYTSPEAAVAGFGILEDETRLTTSDAAFIDRPAPDDLGEAPREITAGIYPDSEGSGQLQVIDVTFRVGNLVGGVSIETPEGVRPDEGVLLDLARRLEERMRAVLDGQSLPGIDPVLPTLMVPASQDAIQIQEGYVSVGEVFGPEAEQAIGFDHQSGYMRSDSYGFDASTGAPVPIVSVALSKFGSEIAPLSLLTNADLVTPFENVSRVRMERIPGTSASLGMSYSNPFIATGTTSVDSFRIMMIVEETIVTIDVQGAASAEAARNTAREVASAYASCLSAGGPCELEPLPILELTSEGGTPAAQD